MPKVMPSAVEVEQSLLGTLLLYPSAPRIAMEEDLSEDDFYVEAHRRIFMAMEELYQSGQPVDITTLSTRLNDRGQLNQVGGIEYLMQLSDAAVTSANTKAYVELLQGKKFLRRMIEVTSDISDRGFEGQVDVDEYIDEAERQVLAITRNRKASAFKSSNQVINEVIENIQKMADNRTEVTGIATGYNDLDHVTHGFQRSDLIIMAARPAMGKTAVMMNLAVNMAQLQPDQAVAIFSLEMPASQLLTRILSARSQVRNDKLRTGRLSNSEWSQVNEAAADLKGTKIFIDDTPGLKTSQIFSKCRKLQADHGLSCILIDYIQLIEGSGKNGDNRQQEVSEISRNLKALARELNVPVIALSQLSRNVETRTDKRPMISDLRESGALEQDADLVILLYRDAYYNKEAKQKADEQGTEAIELIIAKHRNGATGTVNLAFEAMTSAVYNVAKE